MKVRTGCCGVPITRTPKLGVIESMTSIGAALLAGLSALIVLSVSRFRMLPSLQLVNRQLSAAYWWQRHGNIFSEIEKLPSQRKDTLRNGKYKGNQ